MSTIAIAGRSSIFTRAAQRRHARELLDRADVPAGSAVRFEVSGAAPLAITEDLGQVLDTVLRAIAAGDTVTIAAEPQELTTTQAAKQLGISRQTLMKLIDGGDLPAHFVGTHHRILFADIVAFQRVRVERQRVAFEELQSLVDSLDEH